MGGGISGVPNNGGNNGITVKNSKNVTINNNSGVKTHTRTNTVVVKEVPAEKEEINYGNYGRKTNLYENKDFLLWLSGELSGSDMTLKKAASLNADGCYHKPENGTFIKDNPKTISLCEMEAAAEMYNNEYAGRYNAAAHDVSHQFNKSDVFTQEQILTRDKTYDLVNFTLKGEIPAGDYEKLAETIGPKLVFPGNTDEVNRFDVLKRISDLSRPLVTGTRTK